MNTFILIFRLLHVIGGVFWVGGALAMNFFIGGTIRATGDAGKQFAGHLMGRTQFSQYMMYSGIASIVAGFILYGIDFELVYIGVAILRPRDRVRHRRSFRFDRYGHRHHEREQQQSHGAVGCTDTGQTNT